MIKNRINFKYATIPFYKIFLFSFAYAYFRYVYFKGVDSTHIPLYIVNKAIAVSSVLLIGLSYLAKPLSLISPQNFKIMLLKRKYYGVVGAIAGCFHSMISSIELSAGYFDKFSLPNGMFTFWGEISILFGLIALMHIIFLTFLSLPSIISTMDKTQWREIQRGGRFLLIPVFLHLFFMGAQGWFNLSKWYGGMAPTTFISALIIITTFLIRYFTFKWMSQKDSIKKVWYKIIKYFAYIGGRPSKENQ